MVTMPERTSPKDVFLHLLAIIALYISAGSLITLLFQYINLAFPDLLNTYERMGVISAIRWSISALVIIFPVYVLASWFLNKSYLQMPTKRNLRIRKWLIYFTLFVAALIIIGDLVTLIYSFLGGELTTRFIFKALAILAVTGAVFGYYFADVKRHKTE